MVVVVARLLLNIITHDCFIRVHDYLCDFSIVFVFIFVTDLFKPVYSYSYICEGR